MDEKQKEICTIRVMFPVSSDEEAIDIKKKVAELLSHLPESQITFSLANMPTRPPMG